MMHVNEVPDSGHIKAVRVSFYSRLQYESAGLAKGVSGVLMLLISMRISNAIIDEIQISC
jgi:hypothetical protein